LAGDHFGVSATARLLPRECGLPAENVCKRAPAWLEKNNA
jgi:hypothetical protein